MFLPVLCLTASLQTASFQPTAPSPAEAVPRQVDLEAQVLGLRPLEYPCRTYGDSEATAIATGDFNRDGFPDVAAIRSRDNALEVFANQGNGILGAPTEIVFSTTPFSLVRGDVNGDGWLDLATLVDGPSETCVQLILNDGEGGFSTDPEELTVPGRAEHVALGDLNGDGRADVVAHGGSLDDFTVFLSESGGTWAGPVSYDNPRNTYGRPVVGDWNGDGVLDTASNVGTRFFARINLGTGIQSPPIVTVYGGTFRGDVDAGDLNGDGRADIAVAGEGGLWVGLSQGDGTFATSSPFSVPGEATGVAILDLDRDSDLDIAVEGPGFLHTFANVGAGAFVPLGTYPATSHVPIDLSFADLNQDGAPELISCELDNGGPVGDAGSGPSVLRNDGLGGFHTHQAIVGNSNFSRVFIADFNDDGQEDYGVSQADGTFSVSLTGRKGPPIVSAVAGVSGVGDFNGDGLADVVTASGTATVFLNQGDSTFGTPWPSLTTANLRDVVVDDLNADGLADLLLVGGLLGQTVFLNQGDSTFTSQFFSVISEYWTTFDLEGDGDRDLVGSRILFNDGTGTFTTGFPVASNGDIVRVVAADLNGDHLEDLVFDGFINARYRLNIGGGMLGPVVELPMETSDIGAADLDGDGSLDLFAVGRDFESWPLVVFQNEGLGTFAQPQFFRVPELRGALAALDLDADGRPEILGVSPGKLVFLRQDP